MAYSMKLTALIFVSINVILATNADQILPVLMWSSTGKLDTLLPSSVGQSLSTDNFLKNYVGSVLSSVSPLNVVAFEISNLSLEDLSQFGDSYSEDGKGGVFANLKSSLDVANSAALVQISDASGKFQDIVMDDITGHVTGHVVRVNVSASDMDSLESTGSNVVIVDLPKIIRSGEEAIKESLSAADQLIGTVMSAVSTVPVPYLCILLPASTPKSDISDAFSPILRPRRQLMAASSNVTFYDDTCGLLMYSTNISWVLDSPTTATIDITTEDFDTSQTSCNDTDATLVASFTGDVSGLSDFTMKMYFTNSSTEWTMETIDITYTYQSGDYDTTDATNVLAAEIDVPAGMSYHCTEMVLTNGSSESTDYYAHLEFADFQLELGVSDEVFSDADECIGFFTEAIWMGLLASALLLLILTYGMYMMMSITTMDRFDDAKGPAIAITMSD